MYRDNKKLSDSYRLRSSKGSAKKSQAIRSMTMICSKCLVQSWLSRKTPQNSQWVRRLSIYHFRKDKGHIFDDPDRIDERRHLPQWEIPSLQGCQPEEMGFPIGEDDVVHL